MGIQIGLPHESSPLNSSYELKSLVSILIVVKDEFSYIKLKLTYEKGGMLTSLLIKNGVIVTMNPARDILKGDILIKDDRLAAVGQAPDEKADHVIDANGMLIIPGLIQTHIHLCQVLFRGLADDLELLDWLKTRIWPLEAAHDEESLYYSALLGCAELLRGGTTSIIDMGTVHHTDAILEAVSKTGIRYLGGKCLMDSGPEVPGGLKETPEAALRASIDLIRRWEGAEQGRIRWALCPRFVLSCSQSLLAMVSDLASRLKLPVHTHSSENLNEVELVKKITGKPNIVYLFEQGLCNRQSIIAHCVHLNDDEIKLLQESGAHTAHCPSANLKLASGFAPVPRLIDAGIKVSLGADGAPCNNTLSAFMEMRLAALIHKPAFGPRSMPANRVFEMATLNGAEAMGLADDIGSLEEGKKADLALVSMDSWHHFPRDAASVYSHLVYQAAASDVFATIVDGKVLMQDNRLLTIDSDALRSGAAASLQRVKDKAGL